MDQKILKHHFRLLTHLLKILVAERFKRMAKDEVLFKFISGRIDPAVLVDQSLQAEREALDLAEMSLLKLVDRERMEAEIRKSAEKIQNGIQEIFGEDVSKSFSSDALVECRSDWLSVRVEFYRRMLSLSARAESPAELGALAFRNLKAFDEQLKILVLSDRKYVEKVIQTTNALHRFLMTKHLNYELTNFEELWNEFGTEAFRKVPELTE